MYKFVEPEQSIEKSFATRAYVRKSYHRAWIPFDYRLNQDSETKELPDSYFYRVQRYKTYSKYKMFAHTI